jgi:uncharacterized membrane protein YkoI
MFRILSAALLLAAGTAQALSTAPAEHGSGLVAGAGESQVTEAVARDRVTLEQAVRRVRKQYGGRIISAETRGKGDRRVHVIKVLTDDGHVRTVRIPAN